MLILRKNNSNSYTMLGALYYFIFFGRIEKKDSMKNILGIKYWPDMCKRDSLPKIASYL